MSASDKKNCDGITNSSRVMTIIQQWQSFLTKQCFAQKWQEVVKVKKSPKTARTCTVHQE